MGVINIFDISKHILSNRTKTELLELREYYMLHIRHICSTARIDETLEALALYSVAILQIDEKLKGE